MKHQLHDLSSSDSRIATRQFAEGLRQSLNSNCGRIFENAKNLWDRKFAGKEHKAGASSLALWPKVLQCARERL